MMNNFTNGTKNKQFQTAYALYMMIGSYFRKSVCNTKMLEQKLLLYYRDLPVKKQENLEERVILRVEKNLEKVLPALSQLNCETAIFFRNGKCHLVFRTGFESVVAVVDCDGKYSIAVFSEYTGKKGVA